MAESKIQMVHPVGLPTLLPRGVVRLRLLAARQAMGCLLSTPGDMDILPERFSYLPVTTPERFLVIGHVVWDEIRKELAFSTVDGFFNGAEGVPMVFKLTRDLFYNATSGQILEFDIDRVEANIYSSKKITGTAATMLYRMLEEQIARDRKRWAKIFPPDPRAKQVKEPAGKANQARG